MNLLVKLYIYFCIHIILISLISVFLFEFSSFNKTAWRHDLITSIFISQINIVPNNFLLIHPSNLLGGLLDSPLTVIMFTLVAGYIGIFLAELTPRAQLLSFLMIFLLEVCYLFIIIV